jgi:5-methylcytosine-specific restriction enzyme A
VKTVEHVTELRKTRVGLPGMSEAAGGRNRLVYLYMGEGQVGDMEFRSGNKAIRDHAANGKDLLLFKALGKGQGYRFLGQFACASWE